jgi:hypothetical protein
MWVKHLVSDADKSQAANTLGRLRGVHHHDQLLRPESAWDRIYCCPVLQKTPIRRLPGWLAEEWYYVRRYRSGRTSSFRHYVCMLSLGSSTGFEEAGEMVKGVFIVDDAGVESDRDR